MFKKILGTTLIILLALSCVYFAFPDRIVKEARDAVTVGTIEAAGVADATCDGVADNAEALAMLNALPGTGGRISFLTGTYAWANLANVTRAIDNVTIDGTGRGTYIDSDGVTAPFTTGGNNWTISNMRFDAPGPNMAATTGWCWENVTVGATYYAYRTDDLTTGASWNIPTGRSATLTIAASGASATEKAQADYVCDGTDDQVEINAAVAAIDAAYGGRIQLSKGSFGTTDSILIDRRMELVGMGERVTVIERAGAGTNPMIVVNLPAALPNIPFHCIRDMTIAGNNVATDAIDLVRNCPDTRLENLYLLGHTTSALSIVSAAGWDFVLQNLVVEDNGGDGIVAGDSTSGYITDCSVVSNHIGVRLGYNSSWQINGGRIKLNAEEGLIATSPHSLVIQGTMIVDAGGKTPTLNTYDDIKLTTNGVNTIDSVVIANIPYIGAYAMGGSTRYGINIDRNGVDLGASKILIDGVNFGSCATADIKLDTTLDVGNVRIRDVNGYWSIFDDSSFLSRYSVGTTAGWTASNVNGGNTYTPTRVEVNTSVAASSRGMVHTEIGGLSLTATEFYYLLWDRPLHLGFNTARYQSDAQVVARVQLKEANTEGVLAAKGIGLQIDNYTLTAESYGAHRGTNVLGINMSDSSPYTVDVILIPGANRVLIWVVNDIIKVIETDTAHIPSGNSGDVERLVFSIINGVAGGVDAKGYLFQPWIRQVR